MKNLLRGWWNGNFSISVPVSEITKEGERVVYQSQIVKPKATRRIRRSDPIADNQREYLTHADRAICVETKDPADRAHGRMAPRKVEFDEWQRPTEMAYIPAATKRGRPKIGMERAVPRKYPPSAMNTRGVAWDSAYDAMAVIESELAEAGIPGFRRQSRFTPIAVSEWMGVVGLSRRG